MALTTLTIIFLKYLSIFTSLRRENIKYFAYRNKYNRGKQNKLLQLETDNKVCFSWSSKCKSNALWDKRSITHKRCSGLTKHKTGPGFCRVIHVGNLPWRYQVQPSTQTGVLRFTIIKGPPLWISSTLVEVPSTMSEYSFKTLS